MENKEAKYRVQRNDALKRVKVLETIVNSFGVSDDVLAQASEVFKDYAPTFNDGKVLPLTVTEEQKKSLEGLKPKAAVADPAAVATPANDMAVTIATTIAAMQAMGVGGAPAVVAQTPGSATPAQGASKPNNGLDREAISNMSAEEINANWEVVQAALVNGQVTAN